ncbi:hypothetical protein CHS0354_020821 [Potamilus streckersoni]|uniref:Uncharacterized protein n=1 Tax=Potamilus streckersoni TaxID=2493646 RepID=A0AAE0RQN2_9BIVA|nr:hypothetical protein CHS0354_020821 [Potamilus streckersoni]
MANVAEYERLPSQISAFNATTTVVMTLDEYVNRPDTFKITYSGHIIVSTLDMATNSIIILKSGLSNPQNKDGGTSLGEVRGSSSDARNEADPMIVQSIHIGS